LAPQDVNILLVDADENVQRALGEVLDSEGWDIRAAVSAEDGLQALANGAWAGVIADVSVTGYDGPLFQTLKELAHAPAAPPTAEKKRRVRVMFLVPESLSLEAPAVLAAAHLPYAMKPLNLQDVLEKVSDLMIEGQSIAQPLRRVRDNVTRARRTARAAGHVLGRSNSGRRAAEMFAGREDYTLGEEEMIALEKAETERAKAAEAHRKRHIKSLGEPQG
jgi:CheY-like chemotaxis protein